MNLRYISTALDAGESSVVRRPLAGDQLRPVLQTPAETLVIGSSQSVAPSNRTSEEAVTSASYCRVCLVIYSLWFLIAAGSLAVGLWRSFALGDEGKGFTDAAYIVAVGGLVLFPVQARHTQRCQRMLTDGG
jgi:hypothetical protein